MSHEKLLPPHRTVRSGFNRWLDPESDNHGSCGYCSNRIQGGSNVTMYVSDVDLSNGDTSPSEKWWAHQIYCEDCKRVQLLCPREGVTEALYGAIAPVSEPIVEYGICDHSLAPDGVGWDPDAVLEATTGVSLHDYINDFVEDGAPVGHIEIVDLLRSSEIDIRKLIDEDGTVQLSTEERNALQDHVHRANFRDQHQPEPTPESQN
ncbi:hypothetical protein [Halococcus sp. PRR34]|uniref:hypothetical protein n=1 Tax=Halococcus sp. PRR34 TaxID=3020830 RepID=UPI00236119AC|nr:hypothetical protein [Halococcus sp. PRR34]